MNKISQEKTEKLLIDSLIKESMRNGKIEKQDIQEIKKLTGDASSRRYYRIKTADEKYVVCLDEPLVDNREPLFFEMQKILESNGLRVPRVLDSSPPKGYLLEEDLGDVTFLRHLSGLRNQREELAAYELALGQLIKIHSLDTNKFPDAPFNNYSFDKEKLKSEVDFTIKQLIEGLFEQELTNDKKNVLEKTFNSICEELGSQEMVLTHRDFHSRNIMVKAGEQIIIDFQDARMGIPQYDLVSLLEDSYYKISRQNKFALRKTYWENFLEPKGLQPSFEEFSILYDKMAIQRTFKALGSFAYIYRLRGDIRYLKYIGYAFEKMRDILFRYKDYNNLRVVLSEIYYEY